MSAKNIFICYRRDDAEGYAGRLYDRLNARFPGRVFMDVTGISPGADFTTVIRDTVGTCHVLLAIIGRHWTTMKDASDRRRLDLADDYVRHEIATALSRNITVIPVLVRGAQMPTREALPPDLAALSTRNALEITDGDFDHDVHRLIEVLEKVCGEPRPVPVAASTSTGRNSCLIFAVIATLAVGAIVVILVLLGIIAASNSDQSNPNVVQPAATPTANTQAPSTEPPLAPQPDEVDFNPIGQWIVTFEANNVQIQNTLELYRDNSYRSDDETGRWTYSPQEGKLTLDGGLVLTIERQEGNSFVGHGQAGEERFPVRLTPTQP